MFVRFKNKSYDEEQVMELLEKLVDKIDELEDRIEQIPDEHECEVDRWEFNDLEERVRDLESEEK